jgi:radical SAM protein with 4Fe4S-binding SPASM domain
MKSSLRDNFCSSPWFHIRVDPAGNYLPCRWGTVETPSLYNIRDKSLSEYMNSDQMTQLRSQLLNGETSKICNSCHYEEQHSKLSGRQRQLLKSAITIDDFDKSFCSSPHWTLFEYSNNNQGSTNYLPVDLQIDLGNTCNSNCIMCSPMFSSKVALDYIKLNKIEPELFSKYPTLKNWSDDDQLVSKFVSEISDNPNIKYIHFLGGETLYLKSFYSICNQLIDSEYSKTISIGTTTNCTVYSAELEYIIKNFKHVHLGLSIESAHPINDYIRWPSEISNVRDNINKFLDLRKQTELHLALRITPNIFSIYHIDSIFEMMLDNKITAESCDILQQPSCLRIELLPKTLVDQILIKINKIIIDYDLSPGKSQILNRRSEDLVNPVMANVIFEYKHLLETYQHPENVEEERHNLVKFIKAFESLHNNTILSYLPEYEEFLRSYGY